MKDRFEYQSRPFSEVPVILDLLERPELPEKVIEKWQRIINLMANILEVSAGLVLKVESSTVKMFISSETEGNPYARGETADLHTGMYSETVMATKEPLLIPNALEDPEWRDNPDIALNMISYIGYPIQWPGGEVFGTLCMLDSKENHYCSLHRDLMMEFKRSMDEDLCLLMEVTERKRAEAELRLKETQMRAIIESTDDGILVIDDEGNVSYANRRFFTMWRIPPELAAEKNDDKLIASVLAQVKRPEAFLKKIKEAYASADETFDTLEFKDNRVFERYSRPLKDSNKVIGRVWSFRDVTERRRVEEERLRLEKQMQHAQKLESLGVLAGGIAHDFNNILTVIIGNADIAAISLHPEDPAHRNIQQIEVSVKRASELVSQMLAYSGKGRFVLESVQINHIIREMSDLLRVSISKKARLEYNFAHGLPVFSGDVSQVRQIVLNLITNASEALGDQRGLITISTCLEDYDPELWVDRNYAFQSGHDEPLPVGRYVCLRLSDSGCGMDAQTLEKIFDPFFSTKFTGRGLGMAAVLGIVRSHKGVLNVTSKVGEGTTFSVLFPEDTSKPVPQPDQKVDTISVVDQYPGGTILLVDDEESVREVAGLMLEGLGYSVITASDGVEAVEIYNRDFHRIDCVLLDLTMPNMDGVEAFEHIKKIRPDAKVILCSGYSENEALKNFTEENSLSGFLKKPYSRLILEDRLNELLGNGSH